MPIDKIKSFVLRNKVTVILGLVILLVIFSGVTFYKNLNKTPTNLLPDIDLSFEADGPYAILTPRKDGNALILNIKRIASYDAFSYTISYNDETGIDRGAGDLNTWIEIKDKRSDYEQEILFGTCSQGFTSGTAHCVFDEGVENGTLVLRILKGKQPYKMSIQWHMQKPDEALGELTSGDGHFIYKAPNDEEKLSLIAYTIINDLTGVPKLPEGKGVTGKVYTVNPPVANELPAGMIKLELAENPPADSKLGHYQESENMWKELDTKINGSTLEASASAAGIFAVLTNKQ
jgi:hypothetical protein